MYSVNIILKLKKYSGTSIVRTPVIGNRESCPVCGGVLILDSLNEDMSV